MFIMIGLVIVALLIGLVIGTLFGAEFATNHLVTERYLDTVMADYHAPSDPPIYADPPAALGGPRDALVEAARAPMHAFSTLRSGETYATYADRAAEAGMVPKRFRDWTATAHVVDGEWRTAPNAR